MVDYFSSSYEKFIYVRTYSKWLDDLKRREYWDESVNRYKNFFIERVPKNHKKEFEEICESIKKLEVMPSMRALWTSGKALERDNIAGYNCATLIIDCIKSFSELLYILLNGTGSGFSVERQYINKLPEIPNELEEIDEDIVFADSKLGWAEGFNKFLKGLYEGKIYNYDLSKIRPKGSRLKTFGGRASGPEALEELLIFTKDMFIRAKGRKLTSIECHDLCCKIAYIVVVGGVRRSACISLSNLSDQRMAKAKIGQFWEDNKQRIMANNSVAYTEKPDHVSFIEEWLNLVKSKSGERGIFNREGARKFIEQIGRRDPNHDFLPNPCVEILLRPNEFCNLSEVIVRPQDTKKDLCEKIRKAVVLGSLQATLTKFNFLRRTWKKNTEEERLLGVSLSGLRDHPILNKVTKEAKTWLSEMKQTAIYTAREWSQILEINMPAAITCVKPSGTVSQLVNCSSGLHPRFSQYYIRRVRIAATDPLCKMLISQGCKHFPEVGEEYHNAKTFVFEFPQKSPETSIMNDEVKAIDQLEYWLMLKKYWCEHNPSCFTGATKFLTDKGLRRFDSFEEGETTNVLNKKGKFVPAKVNSLGKQRIYKVHLESGKKEMTIETTEDHLWPVSNTMQRHKNEDYSYYQTKDLPIGEQFDSVYINENIKPSEEGILHGIVFGDGTVYNKQRNTQYSRVTLIGEKKEMAYLFEKHSSKITKYSNETTCYGLPQEWKQLPSEKSPEYIKGFIMGWFATDGTVDLKGTTASVSNHKEDNLTWIKENAPIAGISTSNLIHSNYSRKDEKYYYNLTFCKESLTDEFFLFGKHKQRINLNSGQSSKRWKIKEIEETQRYENIYCVEEPEDNHFVLEGNILTHNCTIFVKEDEWIEVGAWVWKNWDYICGLSFLPHTDSVYKLAPYEEITEDEYNELMEKMPEIDFDELSYYEMEDETQGAREFACVGGQCEI